MKKHSREKDRLRTDHEILNIEIETEIKALHPGLAEIFAPDGVSGSDIMEKFRQ